MAHSGICVFVALFVLDIWWAPCSAVQCTEDSIDDCNFPTDMDCRYYQKELACLEAIDNSTCAGELADDLAEYLDDARMDVEECPGLPDGICYYNAAEPCEKDIPYGLLLFADRNDYSEDEKKEMCSKIKGKEDERILCFRSVQQLCKDPGVIAEFDRDIQYVEEARKICAKY